MMDRKLLFREEHLMSIDLLRKSVSEGRWGLQDYRSLKMKLLRCAQEKQTDFRPLRKKDIRTTPSS